MVALRRARAGDEHALALVGAATFLESYVDLVSATDIVAHCAAKHSASFYAPLLASDVWTVFLAEAERTAAPVGFLTMGPAESPVADPTESDIEIHRLYVLAKFQGRRLGARLMDEALAAARAAGKRRVLIGVNQDNAPALGFYARCGFVRIGARKFLVGASLFDDLVLAREIS